MIQSTAALVSLILSLVVIAVAISVARGARERDPQGYATVYRLRRYYAIALISGLAVVLLLTLLRTPYRHATAGAPGMKIDVIGLMWAWDFRIDGERVAQPVVVPVREVVEFAVTSKDVNHGFGIYDPRGHLIAQTQAMPGYVNHLRVRFDEPGNYEVLCLEYCGVGHPIMLAKISVQ